MPQCRQTDFNRAVAELIVLKLLEVDFRSRAPAPRIARASAKPWPARTIAASAFSRACAIGAPALANGPILRRSAKRSAASTASSSACSRAAAPSLLVDAGGAQRLARPAACRSRGRSATATWPAQRRRRRHSPARRSARRAPRDRGSPRAVPAALAQLAREVGPQLRPGRREAPDIAQRQLVQPALVERRRGLARFLAVLMRPFCATVADHQESGRDCSAGRERRARNSIQGRDGVLDRNASVKTELAPAGRDTHARHAAAPPRRFRDARRGARLCRAGPARPQFPRRARHADAAPIPMPSCARTRWRMRAASSRSASSRATASPWSPRPAPSSPPASSARSMPAPGRCRCRCRPASAAAKPMSTSSRSSSNSCDPALFLYPAELAEFGGDAAAEARRRARATGNRLTSVEPAAGDASAGRARTTSPISNIRAARPASRTASRSPTARCSTTCAPTASALKVVRHRPRASRWLPWYHDMGLVGCLLSPVANQMSVDYLKTEDFARRPLAWLDLITPQSGHDASAIRRPSATTSARAGMSSQTRAADRFDLSRWRIAGNGADMIRPDVMQAFVDSFADGRLQGQRLLPQLRPRRSDARGLADAAGRRHPRSSWSRRTSCPAAARATREPAAPLPRDRQLRQAGHAAWRSRSAATTASSLPDRGIGKVFVPRRQRHARLFPRRGIDRAPASATTVGSTPATWATCRTATSSSSAAPRT